MSGLKLSTEAKQVAVAVEAALQSGREAAKLGDTNQASAINQAINAAKDLPKEDLHNGAMLDLMKQFAYPAKRYPNENSRKTLQSVFRKYLVVSELWTRQTKTTAENWAKDHSKLKREGYTAMATVLATQIRKYRAKHDGKGLPNKPAKGWSIPKPKAPGGKGALRIPKGEQSLAVYGFLYELREMVREGTAKYTQITKVMEYVDESSIKIKRQPATKDDPVDYILKSAS
jgi:hypothetical protein